MNAELKLGLSLRNEITQRRDQENNASKQQTLVAEDVCSAWRLLLYLWIDVDMQFSWSRLCIWN